MDDFSWTIQSGYDEEAGKVTFYPVWEGDDDQPATRRDLTVLADWLAAAQYWREVETDANQTRISIPDPSTYAVLWMASKGCNPNEICEKLGDLFKEERDKKGVRAISQDCSRNKWWLNLLKTLAEGKKTRGRKPKRDTN